MWNFVLSLFLVNDFGVDKEIFFYYLKVVRYFVFFMGGLRVFLNVMLILNSRLFFDL